MNTRDQTWILYNYKKKLFEEKMEKELPNQCIFQSNPHEQNCSEKSGSVQDPILKNQLGDVFFFVGKSTSTNEGMMIIICLY